VVSKKRILIISFAISIQPLPLFTPNCQPDVSCQGAWRKAKLSALNVSAAVVIQSIGRPTISKLAFRQIKQRSCYIRILANNADIGQIPYCLLAMALPYPRRRSSGILKRNRVRLDWGCKFGRDGLSSKRRDLQRLGCAAWSSFAGKSAVKRLSRMSSTTIRFLPCKESITVCW